MFREKWVIAASLALGLAAAAVFYLFAGGIFSHRGGVKPADGKAGVMRKYVVAAQDIEMRTRLTENMLITVEAPEEYAHPGAMRSLAKSVGRITRDRILAGETVLDGNLRDEDTPSELSFVLPQGKRAITLEVTVTSGVGNMLRPGDYVDVIVFLDEELVGKNVSFTMLRKMFVLATDTRIIGVNDKGGIIEKAGGPAGEVKGYQSVTLAATPEQCAKLNLMEATGRIKLALHAPDDPPAPASPYNLTALNDIAKEAGFTIQEKKPAGGAVAQSPAPRPAPQPSATAAAPAEPPIGNRRVVRIMRGVAMETVVALAETTEKKRGEK